MRHPALIWPEIVRVARVIGGVPATTPVAADNTGAGEEYFDRGRIIAKPALKLRTRMPQDASAAFARGCTSFRPPLDQDRL